MARKTYDVTSTITKSIYNHLDKKQNVANNITYMLDRSNVMFCYHNLPDSIPARELEKLLQVNGFAIIGEINGTLYALNGGLGGEYDVYNRPTKAVVSVPYLNYSATWDIGLDCVVGLNDTAGIGLLPMFSKFCTMMNEVEVSMLLQTVNKRAQMILSGSDTNTIESAKAFINGLYDGHLGVISDNKMIEGLKSLPVPAGTDVTDLIELEQYLKASMYNEIGLNSNYNMKRERLTTAEVNMNTDNLYPLVDNMLAMRREMVNNINEKYGLSVEVEFNSSWDYRVFQGQSIHNTEDEISPEEVVTDDSSTSDNGAVESGELLPADTESNRDSDEELSNE